MRNTDLGHGSRAAEYTQGVKLIRKRNSIVTILVMSLIFVVGLVFVVACIGHTNLLSSFGTQLGIAMMITMGLGALWDFAGKRWLMDELYEKMNVGLDIQRWGLKRATLEWSELSWKEFFSSATSVDLIVGYGRTWRNASKTHLETFLESPAHRLRVCLPDPKHEWLMVALGKRFNTDSKTVREAVLESAKYYMELRDNFDATVQIFFRTGEPTHAVYKSQSSAVVTLYPHRKGRGGEIPTMIVGPGELLDFLEADFEEVVKTAREVSNDEVS